MKGVVRFDSPKTRQPGALWMKEEKEALQLSLQRFEEVRRSFAAPARVNLIGEPTDCAGGLVNVDGNKISRWGRT